MLFKNGEREERATQPGDPSSLQAEELGWASAGSWTAKERWDAWQGRDASAAAGVEAALSGAHHLADQPAGLELEDRAVLRRVEEHDVLGGEGELSGRALRLREG